VHVEGSGVLSGDRLVLYLSGEGSCLIDDVRVAPKDAAPSEASPAQNAVQNPGFEEGTAGWDFRGNHSGSRKETGAKEGKACLGLAATGPGFGEIHSASTKLSGIREGTPVTLSFWARAEKGAVRVLARISGEGLSTEAELPLIGGSPGAPNRIQ